MSLHRAEAPDWGKIAPSQRNHWQRMAARTHGAVTPANLVSLVGGLLVIYGLLEIINDSLATGVTAIFLGRCADILDGAVADKTQTKSPFGEAVDATIDKIVIGVALIIFFSQDLLPLIVIVFMAVHAIYNSLLSLAGFLLKLKLHPSSAGKIGTAAEWLSIGMYLISSLLKDNGSQLAGPAAVIAAISFGVFLVLAINSAIEYTQQFRKQVAAR